MGLPTILTKTVIKKCSMKDVNPVILVPYLLYINSRNKTSTIKYQPNLVHKNVKPITDNFHRSPSVAHDEDSKSAFTISAMDASAIARGVRKPAL